MAPPAPPKRTNPWLIVFICFGIVALGIVAVIVGVVWWVNANKDRLASMAKEAEESARAHAKDHDQEGCIDEGLRRIDRCDGIMCRANAKVFTERCMIHARATPGLCERAPPDGEIMRTVAYVEEQCQRRGRRPGDQGCSQIMQSVPPACAARARANGP